MNKLAALLVLSLIPACQQVDTAELEDSCTQVVKDGLATCTQDAWALCDQSYEQVMADMQRENDQLRQDMLKLAASFQLGCNGFVNGAIIDYMELNHCVYDPPTYSWSCTAGPLCEAPAPSP